MSTVDDPILEPLPPKSMDFDAQPKVQIWAQRGSNEPWRWVDSDTYAFESQGTEGIVFCDTLQLRTISVGTSQARLRMFTGHVTPSYSSTADEGREHTFVDAKPLDLMRKWVRVVVKYMDSGVEPREQTLLWVGLVIQQRSHNNALVRGRDGETFYHSDMMYEVVGPEWLLTRRKVVSALFHDPDADADAPQPYKILSTGVTFNDTKSDPLVGRKIAKGNAYLDYSGEDGALSDALYERDLSQADMWTGQAILLYLLSRDFTGPSADGLSWTWQYDVDNLGLLEWTTPVIETHGQTQWQIIQSLCSSSRGVEGGITYTGDEENEQDFGQPGFELYSVFAEETTLPSGATIAANPRRVSMTIGDDRGGALLSILDSTPTYEFVRALGELPTSTCTLATNDYTLVKGWSDADQSRYETGATEQTDYAALDPSTQEGRDEVVQKQRYPHVFTQYVLTPDWDGLVYNGLNAPVDDGGDPQDPPTAEKVAAFPTGAKPEFYWVDGMRIKSQIALKQGWDYLSQKPSPTADAPAVDEFRKLQVWLRVPKEGGDWAGKYVNANKLDSLKDDEALSEIADVMTQSVTAYELDSRCGIRFVTGYGHVMGRHRYTPNANMTDNFNEPPIYDWKNDIICTVQMEAHRRISGEWPVLEEGEDPPTRNGDVTYLHIQTQNTAYLDYMPKGTVIDVNQSTGELVRTTSEQFLRDDRQYLQDLARMAYQWHGSDRQSVQFRYKRITNEVKVGDLVVKIDDKPVNTVVTAVYFDFMRQETVIYTSLAKPDFVAIGREGR